ncbi:MAG TPA: 50S ribosomal protein L13 [Phycisphaerae bacterium]|nr:50S ribosomal protein L13 [Phycisphaerae bacterium]
MVNQAVKTYVAKKGELPAKWYLADADGKILGRLATRIATILMGKHRPEYTPHVDTGEFVVVINAEKVRMTGSKWAKRTYEHYTKYPGGRRAIPAATVLAKHPDRIIREAVRRMLPKSKLGRAMIRKLKVYAGPDHPHQAQKVEPLEL